LVGGVRRGRGGRTRQRVAAAGGLVQDQARPAGRGRRDRLAVGRVDDQAVGPAAAVDDDGFGDVGLLRGRADRDVVHVLVGRVTLDGDRVVAGGAVDRVVEQDRRNVRRRLELPVDHVLLSVGTAGGTGEADE